MSITAMRQAVAILQVLKPVAKEPRSIATIDNTIATLCTAISEAEKQEPMAWQERQQTKDGWTVWYACSKPLAYPSCERVTGGITYQWRPLFLAAGAQPAPKQEPVGIVIDFDDSGNAIVDHACEPVTGLEIGMALYTAPPQAQSDHIATTGKMVQPLTCDEIDKAIQQHVDPVATYLGLHRFARAIEQAHGIGEQP